MKKILYQIRYKVWSLLSRMAYAQVNFLDTSIIEAKRSSNLRIHLKKKYFITDQVINELKDHENTHLLPRRFKAIGYHDLINKNPNLCPVYMNYVGSCFNPAVVASSDFIDNLFMARKFTGTLESDEEKDFYRIRDARNNRERTKPITIAKRWRRHLKLIEEASGKHLGKKIKDLERKHRFSDYNTFVIAILYCIHFNKHVILETADKDFLAIAFSWAESMGQSIAFNNHILTSLSPEDKRALVDGKTLYREFQYDEYAAAFHSMITDILDHKWKKMHRNFTIRFWDSLEKRYHDFLLFNFDQETSEIFRIHGPLLCPYAQNTTMGNWLKYIFYPPEMDHPDTIRFDIACKSLVNTNARVGTEHHVSTCKFAKQYESGDFSEYLGFRTSK